MISPDSGSVITDRYGKAKFELESGIVSEKGIIEISYATRNGEVLEGFEIQVAKRTRLSRR